MISSVPNTGRRWCRTLNLGGCKPEPFLGWSWPHFVAFEILSGYLEIFSILHASNFAEIFLRLGVYVFYVNFENSSICDSMWRKTMKGSTGIFGLFEGRGPQRKPN